jgi:hypothetical protein
MAKERLFDVLYTLLQYEKFVAGFLHKTDLHGQVNKKLGLKKFQVLSPTTLKTF